MTTLSDVSLRRALLYGALAGGVVLWAAIVVYLAATAFSVDHYLISYYVADYRFGFVRRGLAGELVGPASGESFFDNARIVRWALTGSYVVGLGIVAAWVLRGRATERKYMLALLIFVLPFGIPFAVVSARPDLLGAVALIGLGVAMATSNGRRPALVASALFGTTIFALAFVHEASAFEFGLGAILAILVLGRELAPSIQRLCMALALVPGLLAAGAVALFARKDVSDPLCADVPHRLIDNPAGAIASFQQLRDYLATGQRAQADYHDWVCGWYLGTYDYSVTDGMKEVLAIGAPGLLASFALGVFGIAVSIGAVSFVSKVPFRDFLSELRGQLLFPVFGLALMVPVFVTGFDWARWLMIIAFNIVVVYVLYIRGMQALDEAPTSRDRRLFVLIVVAFAVIPLGVIPGGSIG